MTPRMVVTGATGLVGGAFCRHFASRGWDILGLARSPADRKLPDLPIQWLACDLPNSFPDEALAGADAVIHCAYDTRGLAPDQAERVNVEGTRRVLRAAREGGAHRFVFVSSLSAHPGARSLYGRTKHALEAEMDPSRDLVLRAGLVLSNEGGLIGEMVGWIQRHAWVPVPAPRKAIHTILVSDLAQGLEVALENGLTGTIHLAHPRPISMIRLVHRLSHAVGGGRILVPIPVRAAILATSLLEFSGLSGHRYSERLKGLRDMPVVDLRSDAELLGLTLRSPEESLALLRPPGHGSNPTARTGS